MQAQHTASADTRQEWRTRVLADPQLGGAGHATAMASIARMRDLFVASPFYNTKNVATAQNGANVIDGGGVGSSIPRSG